MTHRETGASGAVGSDVPTYRDVLVSKFREEICRIRERQRAEREFAALFRTKGRVGGGALTKAFGAIERRLSEVVFRPRPLFFVCTIDALFFLSKVAAYVDEWLQYQSLW